jgi:hypothetical protein
MLVFVFTKWTEIGDMKLLLCTHCQDVFKLSHQERRCECGATRGRYLEDGHHAVYSGPGVPLGLDNIDLSQRIRDWQEDILAEPRINCWIMNKYYARFKKIED